MELDGVGKIESGTSNGVPWEKSAMMGPRVKSGDEKAQSLRESTFNSALNWRKIYSKAETVGVENVEGQECYKVTLTPAEGKPETNYYSKKTGLHVKSAAIASSPMGEVPVEVIISDYKDFDGILQPTKMIQRVAGQELVITIQSVKTNEEIPADKFDPPADIKALMNKQ
jgi:outer membrane lipoprotein-sorting protein